MKNDKFFERADRRATNSIEEWGENKHGYFSFESGTFIPKEEVKEEIGGIHIRQWPPFGVEVSPSWPGELTEEREE